MDRLPNALAAATAPLAINQPTRHTPGPWAWDEHCNVLRPVHGDPFSSAVHTILGPDGPMGYLGSKPRDSVEESAANYRLIETAPTLLSELRRLRNVLNAAGYATDRTDAVIATATGAAS